MRHGWADEVRVAKQSSDEPLEHSFEVRAVEADGGYAWAELTPLAGEVSFTRIRLGFDGETLRTMELEDAFGQLTRLEFSDVERNPSLDESLFTFTPPEGADVFRD